MLNKNNITEYWNKRSQQQGKLTVGPNNHSLKEQDAQYQEREEFIFNLCPQNLITLDYGCGVGRYAKCFDKYIGIDITKNLLEVAQKENPKKQFTLINNVGDISDVKNIELFFAATVLQHCSDEVVDLIIKNANKNNVPRKLFCFYENSSNVQANHVKGRRPEEYLHFVEKYFEVIGFVKQSHIIHTEKHSLSLISVK